MLDEAAIPANESRRLAALHGYGILDSEAEPAFDRIAALAARRFDVPVAAVSLVDRDRQWFKACHGSDLRETPRHLALCAHAILSEGAMVIADTHSDQRFAAHPLVAGEPAIRFYAGYPLNDPEGLPIGTLCLIDTRPRPDFGPVHTELLRDYARLVMDMIVMRAALRAADQEARSRADTEGMLSATRHQLGLFIEHTPTAIAMFDTRMRYIAASRKWMNDRRLDGQDVIGKSHYDVIPNLPKRWRDEHRRSLAGESIRVEESHSIWDRNPGWIRRELHPWRNEAGEIGGIIIFTEDINERKAVEIALQQSRVFCQSVVENVQDGIIACDDHGRLALVNSATRRLLGLAPEDNSLENWGKAFDLFAADGKTRIPSSQTPLAKARKGGVVDGEELVVSPSDGARRRIVAKSSPMHDSSGAFLGAVVSMHDVTAMHESRIALQESEARSREIAFRDQVTGLANRAHLDRFVAADPLSAPGRYTAVYYIDLDRFKAVNDTFGHDTGDRLLVEVATLLLDLGGPEAFVARISGDEFAMIAGFDTRDQAMGLGQNVLDRLSSPIEIGETRVTIGASIGVALLPLHGDSLSDLLRRADLALNEAKRAGRMAMTLFEPAMELAALQRQEYERDLKYAVRGNQLLLQFQPIVCSATRAIVGYEALLRWLHPVRGLIQPAAFLQIAEQSGLIFEIDEWVIDQALSEIAGHPDMIVSVNLSSASFQRENIAAFLEAALKRNKVAPDRLEVEVTESLLDIGAERARRQIERVKALGIRLSLDDFGSGRSALAALHTLPIDRVKIARDLVARADSDAASASVMQSIISLARALGMGTCAMGVETRDQEAFLKSTGCTQFQGFLYGRPDTAEKIGCTPAGQKSKA